MSTIPVNAQTKRYLNKQKLKNIIAYKEHLVRDFKASQTSIHQVGSSIEIVWHSNSGSSIWDLNSTKEPGLKYYQKNRKALFESLNKLVKKITKNNTGQRVIIGVSGHGLNGALAQYCLTDLAGIINSNSKKTIPSNQLNGNNIHGLELTAFNSVGVNEDTYKKAAQYSVHLSQLPNKIPITAYYSLNDGDGIQQIGKYNILAEAEPYISNVYVFKFKQPKFWQKIKETLQSSKFILLLNQLAGLSTLSASLNILSALSIVSNNNRETYSKNIYLNSLFTIAAIQLQSVITQAMGTWVAHTTINSKFSPDSNAKFYTDFEILNNLNDSEKTTKELLHNKSILINNKYTNRLAKLTHDFADGLHTILEQKTPILNYYAKQLKNTRKLFFPTRITWPSFTAGF